MTKSFKCIQKQRKKATEKKDLNFNLKQLHTIINKRGIKLKIWNNQKVKESKLTYKTNKTRPNI